MLAAKQAPMPPVDDWFSGHMSSFNGDTLQFLDDTRAYGDLIRFRFGPFQAYIAHHPDIVRDILVTKASAFAKAERLRWALADISGENLFTSNGDFWKKQRKLMQPAFHAKQIGNYADTMVDYSQKAIETWQDGTEMNIDDAMTKLTMNIITKTMFDMEIGAEAQAVGELFTRLFKIVDERAGMMIQPPHWLPTPLNREVRDIMKQLNDVVQGFIDERRKGEVEKKDLLSMLLAAQAEDGSHMSDEQIMREALTIFGAGHETTAYTLTFAWYALSQNPDVEARFHEEIDRVLQGRSATLADLPKLPYTNQVIKETLRLYPAAWGFSRDVLEDVELGGYLIPKGSVILGAPWSLGRDPRWFENPLDFNPERFSAENESKMQKYAYIPFGAGPRVCIGNQFAMMEAALILATVAQHYRFSLKPNFATRPVRAFTLRPNNGMVMMAHARQLEMAF